MNYNDTDHPISKETLQSGPDCFKQKYWDIIKLSVPVSENSKTEKQHALSCPTPILHQNWLFWEREYSETSWKNGKKRAEKRYYNTD